MKRKHPTKARRKAISLDSGHLEGPWPGHFPVTSVALLSLLERVSGGERRFSPAERVLFVACEFWSAFNAGELDSYFDLKAEDPTHDSRIALRVIGASEIASALDQGVLGPAGGRAEPRRRRRLVILEEKMRGISEPIDLLIARFAWRCMTTQRRSAVDIPFHAPPGTFDSQRDPLIAG